MVPSILSSWSAVAAQSGRTRNWRSCGRRRRRVRVSSRYGTEARPVARRRQRGGSFWAGWRTCGKRAAAASPSGSAIAQAAEELKNAGDEVPAELQGQVQLAWTLERLGQMVGQPANEEVDRKWCAGLE